MVLRRIFQFSTLLALLLLVGGCGSGEPRVSGRVLNPSGEPLNIDPMKTVYWEVKFVPADDDGKIVSATPGESDNTFTVESIPRGKYKVKVRVMDTTNTAQGDVDRFRGKYWGEKTPIEVEITGSTSDLVIDLSKYDGNSK